MLYCLLKRDAASHVSGGQGKICCHLVPNPTAAVDVQDGQRISNTIEVPSLGARPAQSRTFAFDDDNSGIRLC